MRHILFTFLVFNSAFLCYSQDTISAFVKLIHGKDTIYFDDIANKTICSKIDSDSAREIVEIFETLLLKDTILARPNFYDYFSYKSTASKNSTIHYGSNTKDRVKIPINKIYYVKKSRDGLKLLTGLAITGSLISGLIIAPLVSLGKPFKTNTYYSIAVPSLAIFATALTVNIAWGNKYYYTQKHKNRRIWKIE